MWFVIFYCEFISGICGAFVFFPCPVEVPSALGWRNILRDPSFYFASSWAPRVSVIPRPVLHQLNSLGFPYCAHTVNLDLTSGLGSQFLMGDLFFPPTPTQSPDGKLPWSLCLLVGDLFKSPFKKTSVPECQPYEREGWDSFQFLFYGFSLLGDNNNS